MSEVLDRARVPVEFTGLARGFRGAIKAEDTRYDEVVASIAAPLRARLQRHPRLRHEQIAQAVRCYQGFVPSKYRIGKVEIERDRSRFSIREVRICPAWFNNSLWHNDNYREPGCAVCRFNLFAEPGRLRRVIKPIAVASLHALGRRLQRGRGRDHPALVRDLGLLADAPDGGDAVATPEADGSWIGGMVQMNSQDGWSTARAVRTWHADDGR
jgi:hypothetical protein